MTLYDEKFFNLIRNLGGEVVTELLKVQSINSARTLLRMTDVYSFLDLDSDGTTVIKPGVANNINYIFTLLRFKKEQLKEKEKNVDYESDMLYSLVQNNPLLKALTRWYQKAEQLPFTEKQTLLPTLIDNITNNLSKSTNNYRYDELVQRFAVILYILGGKFAYNFVRLNLVCALPCPTTITNLIKDKHLKLNEAEFRFDVLEQHFMSKNSKYGFASEDTTGIIKKVVYNTDTNSFIGFCTPLDNGVPVAHHFRTESFYQLKEWFAYVEKAALLNLHMIQPLSQDVTTSSSFILSAYGISNTFTSSDIVQKWIYIFNECSSRNIRIIGFATVKQRNLPKEALNIFLFSSQPCESTFENARALSGIYHTVVNFTAADFLRRSEKLSILNEEKCNNVLDENDRELKFPIHHKESRVYYDSLSKNIILAAFNRAKELVSNLNILPSLKECNACELNGLSKNISDSIRFNINSDNYLATYSDSSSDSESDYDDEAMESNEFDSDLINVDEEDKDAAMTRNFDEIKTEKINFT
ncbi:unnamed protein product, partial [Rotaria sp. Silwood1]